MGSIHISWIYWFFVYYEEPIGGISMGFFNNYINEFNIFRTEMDYSKKLQKIFHFLNLPRFKLKKYEIIRQRKYSKLDPKTRKKLNEFFKPYNKELYEHIGIALIGTNNCMMI